MDACVEARGGNLSSKASFGNCQVHVEWMAPANFKGPWYNQKVSTGPLLLSGHGCPVRFRNIWVRPLLTSWTDLVESK